ncbi:MAG: PucR family transcriptional regulator ligand-binding domain-containing protein [Bacillus sp. (in: Bacteria)]|nr:PucR family transcriptional regulator ligand-binding domain-containing protein [Bacillus sp. (in: firmicutes)]
MLTVKDLLHIKSIEGIRLVAGEKGINNIVSVVNIMDNPDTFDWLSSNELLLSTGYIFKDNVELQNNIIKELSEINCSGLIIKVKRYFDQIPENMINLANQYGLPLLELPYGYSLSKVISTINEKVSGRYDLLNRRSLDIHNKLFSISLEGGSIEKISSELANTINNPVIILDRDLNLLNYVDLEDNNIPLKSYLSLLKNRPVFTKDFTDMFPENISQIKKSIKRLYKTNDIEITCRILPVAVSNYIYGYIVVWQTIRELTTFDNIVIEQASTIIALDRIKAREIEEVKVRIRQEFFDDLLTGNITSSHSLQTLCDIHGLKSDYKYYCIVIDIEPIEVNNNDNLINRKYMIENKAKKCVNFVYDFSNQLNGEIICFYRNNRIIILIGKNEYNPTLTINEAKTFSNEFYKVLNNELLETTFLIGIGRQYNAISTLHKSFSEANEAIRLMKQFDKNTGVSHFEDYYVYHFLGSNIKTVELEDFFMKCLGKIYDHDHLQGTSYIHTLESYFNNNHNLSETSKAMFIHRNTLIYRIEKIKEILNTDMKNSEEVLQIQLALKIYRLLNKGSHGGS